MKHTKKIMALIIAMVMMVGMMGVMASADDGDLASDNKISVTELTDGDKVLNFQIIKWVDGEGWDFTSDFKYDADDNPNGLKPADLEEIIGDYSVNPVEPGKITQEMANKISALAQVGDNPSYETVSGTTWEKSSPDPGLYMVVVAAKTPGVVYNPVFVAADFDDNDSNSLNIKTATYSDTAVAKKKDNEVKKTTSDTDQKIKEAIDSYVGQVVDFKVETTIPVFLNIFKNPSFVIDDTIKTSGIELVPGTIKIYLGDSTTAITQTTTDVLTLEEHGKTGYTVTFAEKYLKGNGAPVDVRIEYNGKITNKADFNVNEDDNEVTVTHTNGPNNEKAAMMDRTNHYTFSIGADVLGYEGENGKTYEFVKVGVDSSGNPVVSKKIVSEWDDTTERHPLAGATFALFIDEACEHPYTNDLYPSSGATFTTTGDGIITFKGLSAGTYYLKETQAPKGYIKDNRVAKVTIAAYYKDVHVNGYTDSQGINVSGYDTSVLDYYTVTVNNVSVYEGDIYAATSENVVSTYRYNNVGPTISHSPIEVSSSGSDGDLTNPKGVELPSTGGMGTTIFYIIGAILVLGAGVLLVTRRRMHTN